MFYPLQFIQKAQLFSVLLFNSLGGLSLNKHIQEMTWRPTGLTDMEHSKPPLLLHCFWNSRMKEIWLVEAI